MRVVIAPDSMGGMLTARELATEVGQGWRRVHPAHEVVLVPMSDGGEGLLDVVHRPTDRVVEAEVAGPLGHPVDAWLSLRDDGTAVVESALACGLARLPDGQRDPLRATTYGVGQLMDAAREAGARRILVGLGGSATVEGGAGALTGLGFRLRVADGSGLKVGAADLHRVATIEPGWRHPDWDDLAVILLADVRTALGDAARRFGPQKGATDDDVPVLADALAHWEAVVAEQCAARGLAQQPGTGAAGGLGYGLAAALGATVEEGAAVVAELVGLDDAVASADVVVTGEGRVDATSFDGKVVDHVLGRGRAGGARLGLVAGAVASDPDIDRALGGGTVVELASATDVEEARMAARAAGERLARRLAAP